MMIQARTKVVPRLAIPRTSTRLDRDWSKQLSILLGVCEEYQSSTVGMANLRAAIRREPCLETVLQSPLTEMWKANRSLRQEVLGLLDDVAGRIGGDTASDLDSVG